MDRPILNYWDDYEVKQINVHEIIRVYMTRAPRHPDKEKIDLFEVKVVANYRRKITVRQEERAKCMEYMSGFEKVGFVPAWGRAVWINPEHINPLEEGEDLENGHIYPLFTTEPLENIR